MSPLLDKIAMPLGIVLLISLVIGAYILVNKYNNGTVSGSKELSQDRVIVDVAGAVYNPGVYTLGSDAIVEDAIDLAGGLTENADRETIARTINRAAPLSDHSKVYIPSTRENNSLDGETPLDTVSTTSLININTASSALLDTLPGIGPITASRIIEHRETVGPFLNKTDIMKVEGISSSKFDKLKSLITI